MGQLRQPAEPLPGRFCAGEGVSGLLAFILDRTYCAARPSLPSGLWWGSRGRDMTGGF